VDLTALSAISPDLIITQDLCHVCAATPDDLGAALAHLPRRPEVVTLNPHSLADVCVDIRAVARATGTVEQGNVVVGNFERDVAQVDQAVAGLPGQRVLCLEWLDPPYVAGHWVPEMVTRAGGIDVLGRAGEPSFRVEWETIFAAQPDVIVLMPCGYGLQQVAKEFRDMALPEGWEEMPAVRNGRVFLVEASGYFSRPGPRLAAGVAILADAIHAGQQANLTPSAAGLVLARVAAAGM
jgi:iron complex transport system substrate-binding protein